MAALIVYNLIFVLPPFVLLAVHVLFGTEFKERTAAMRVRLERASWETAMWIIGIVGFSLALDALVFFEFFGPVQLPAWLGGVGSSTFGTKF